METLDQRVTSPGKVGEVTRATQPPRRRTRLQPSGFFWLIPAMIVSFVLIYFSVGYTIFISTLDWDGISPNQESVGLDNYLRALGEPIFWGALRHTTVYLVFSFVGQAFFGFLFAVILHSAVRLRGLYKVLVFVPVIIAPAIMAPVFRQIFANEGQFNGVLSSIGLDFLTQPWLAQSSTALPVIIAIAIWQHTGLYFVLYYAALGQVDPEVLEAARLDGAGNARMMWSIIWPQVRGTTIALLMLCTINSLKLFDIPQLVTHGGPNYSTEFLGTYIYRESIPLYDVGYGAALSIFLLILAIGTAVLFSLRGRKSTPKDV
ncbi:carbohydrate ABC transporter permease [Homoserinimonas sp. A447]